jgi:endonuclease YncB( thermonuclease family)
MRLIRLNSIIFLLFFLCSLGYSQTYNGTIIRVIDGESYVFQTQEGSFIVRMFGIDAPERDQPFAKESADFLKQYLNQDAILKVNGTYRYARRLGILFVEGQDINLLSIKGGYSWHFKRYSSDQDYASAEEYAKKNKLGLWKLDDPVPPWNWRKK